MALHSETSPELTLDKWWMPIVNDEGLAFTPRGYYFGSPNAIQRIRWRVGAETFSVERSGDKFHRPDMVREALAQSCYDGALRRRERSRPKQQTHLNQAPSRQENDWPTMRHDAHNTGYTSHEVSPPLRLAWRVQAYSSVQPFLLASGGAVCVSKEAAGKRPEVSLFSHTGRLLWQVKNAVSLYLKDKRLIVAAWKEGDQSSLQCYNWQTKTLNWSHALEGTLEGVRGAVAEGGRLYCLYSARLGGPGWREVLRVLNLKDGRLMAERVGGIQDWGAGPPACDGQYLYYGSGHWLYMIDIQNLQPQLQPHFAFFDGGNCHLISAGQLIIGKGWLGWIHAWGKETRRLAWKTGGPRDVTHCLAKGQEGKMLLIESSTARDLSTGATVWQYPVYGLCSAGAGRFVYMAGSRSPAPLPDKPGGFYGFDAASGRFHWKHERTGLRGVAVIASEGSLYCLDSEGFLYRFVTARRSHR